MASVNSSTLIPTTTTWHHPATTSFTYTFTYTSTTACSSMGTDIYPPTGALWWVFLVTIVTLKVVGIVGNIVVFVAIVKLNEMRSPLYYSLANLAVADILFLGLTGVITTGEFFGQTSGYVGLVYCYIQPFAARSSSQASVSFVTFIGIERYIAVCHPMKSLYVFRHRRIAIIITTIWISSCVVAIPYVYQTSYTPASENCPQVPTCNIELDDFLYYFSVTVISACKLFPVVFLGIIYTIMVRKLFEKPKHMPRMSLRDTKSKKRQAVLMTAIVAAVFAISICPFQLFLLITHVKPEVFHENISEYTHICIIWSSRVMAYINSASNPLIYTIVSRDFRQKIGKAYQRKRLNSIRSTRHHSHLSSSPSVSVISM